MPEMDEKKRIMGHLETIQERFWRISDAIWGYAELGLQEYRSAALLSETLQQAGFSIQSGVAGMPTAFVATWQNGSGRPVIGLTAEYDALPGLSQKVGVLHKEALVEGAPGHGCSHNTMAAMQALAVVSLQETIRRNRLDVTLKYYGCPAEELGISRPYLIRAGVFDDVDVIIDCHADALFKTTYGMLGTALHSVLIAFEGRTAHAAWRPWQGRSAADAVELLHAGTERMREHLTPSNRIHWVTTFAGDVPNTIPDRAETWYYVRNLDELIEADVNWLYDCVKGAALMTQTQYAIKVLAAVHQRFYNRTLSERLFVNMCQVGRPHYHRKEVEFAEQLQKAAGMPPIGLDYPVSLIDAEADELRASSSDIGDLCLVVPVGQISIPVWVPGTPAHSWLSTTMGATSIAHKGISAAAKAVAMTVYDLLTDPCRLESIKTEFALLQGHRPYRSFLPPEAKPPLDFYQEAMKPFLDSLFRHGDRLLAGDA
jgi:aminobenzoyl-glutamate utilization protein B